MTNTVTPKTELYFSTTNEPGTLATWANPLRENGINIEAICAYTADNNTAYFRFITSDNAKAINFLTEKGYKVAENNVICWTADNTPGNLFNATCAIAEKGIDVAYTYAGCITNSNTGYVVFSTTNVVETENVLNACCTTGSC